MDEEKLKDFLSKGELTVRHVRCIIVGCSGAGKTTLLKRLQNAKFKDIKNIKTTELVDVHVNIFEVLENEATIQSNVYTIFIDKGIIINVTMMYSCSPTGISVGLSEVTVTYNRNSLSSKSQVSKHVKTE